jgi:hypothetical protein
MLWVRQSVDLQTVEWNVRIQMLYKTTVNEPTAIGMNTKKSWVSSLDTDRY